MKTQWNKMPSVTREGKFFYTAQIGLDKMSVSQSWLTGGWKIQLNDKTELGRMFNTSKGARRYCEQFVNHDKLPVA